MVVSSRIFRKEVDGTESIDSGNTAKIILYEIRMLCYHLSIGNARFQLSFSKNIETDHSLFYLPVCQIYEAGNSSDQSAQSIENYIISLNPSHTKSKLDFFNNDI